MIRKWFRRKPLNVLEGGTGANTSEKACENLGAVKKTGDIISGNLEFYGGEDSEGNSVIHPIVNAKVNENGINAVVGGSNNDSSLVLGCGDFANNLEPSGGDLILTAKNFIRFFQVRSGNLAERWRFSDNGYLQHINPYDAKEYYPFCCKRTYTKDNVQKETLAGAIRINSSIGQSSSFIQGSNNTMFGLQSVDAANANNSNYLFLGASTNSKNVSRKVVSFRPGLTGSSINDSTGKADAEAWRAALVSDKGYGLSGNDSSTVKKWATWLHLSWTALANHIKSTSAPLVTSVKANANPTKDIAQFRIPEDAREILLYCRADKPAYNYGSTLVISRDILTSLGADGRTFMLGGGWNNEFGGDAAKIKLRYITGTDHNKDFKLLCLRVIGVSVKGSWIGNNWICYWR